MGVGSALVIVLSGVLATIIIILNVLRDIGIESDCSYWYRKNGYFLNTDVSVQKP